VLEGGVASFPHIHRDRVRFRDCDAMGHVNNAVFSTYLEESRIGVLGGLNAFILARVEIDFRSELRMGEEVEVRTSCSRIGTKSFDLEHVIAAGGRVVAEAKSVLVSYDYERGESVPIPDALRKRLTYVPGEWSPRWGQRPSWSFCWTIEGVVAGALRDPGTSPSARRGRTSAPKALAATARPARKAAKRRPEGRGLTSLR
jgi:acyl-CoA thioester hydrolase